MLGSAAACCSFAGQFSARTGIVTFVADQVVAPEKPFPAGVSDSRAAHQAMGITRINFIVVSARGTVDLQVREGMPHVLPCSFAMHHAGEASMGKMADFVRKCAGP